MSNLEYPTIQDVHWWIEYLAQENTILRLKLPKVDDHWFAEINNILERATYSYSETDLHTRAAELFYNINKAHNYIDGNKRSSIVVVYLFYVINRHMILPTFNIREVAKRVAKSHGRNNHDQWIEKLRIIFRDNTAPFQATNN